VINPERVSSIEAYDHRGRVSLRHEAAMNQPFADAFDPLQSVTSRRVAPQSNAL
jgi:hypothetical protein